MDHQEESVVGAEYNQLNDEMSVDLHSQYQATTTVPTRTGIASRVMRNVIIHNVIVSAVQCSVMLVIICAAALLMSIGVCRRVKNGKGDKLFGITMAVCLFTIVMYFVRAFMIIKHYMLAIIPLVICYLGRITINLLMFFALYACRPKRWYLSLVIMLADLPTLGIFYSRYLDSSRPTDICCVRTIGSFTAGDCYSTKLDESGRLLFQHQVSGFSAISSNTVGNVTITTASSGFVSYEGKPWIRLPMFSLQEWVYMIYCVVQCIVIIVMCSIP